MRRCVARRGAFVVVVGLGLGLLSVGCAAIERAPADNRPTVRITLLDGKRDGAPCDVVVERREGAPPKDARLRARLRLESDRPVPARFLDDVAKEWCAAHCVSHYTLLRAEEEPGGARTAIEIWAFDSADANLVD